MAEIDKNRLYEHFMGKYENQNVIAKWLLKRFFLEVKATIDSLPEECNVLEVGCGPGESSLRLASMMGGRHFEVSEYEQAIVDYHLDNQFPIKIIQESVYSLNREDNQFDVVVALEVLEHLEDYQLALREMCRVAAKKIIVSVPNEPVWRLLNLARGSYWGGLGNTPGHINHWSPTAFVRLLSGYGVCEMVKKPLPWTIVVLDVA